MVCASRLLKNERPAQTEEWLSLGLVSVAFIIATSAWHSRFATLVLAPSYRSLPRCGQGASLIGVGFSMELIVGLLNCFRGGEVD